MKKTAIALLLFVAAGLGAPAFAAEPTLHEVYQTAESGKLDQARQMMQEVLKAHPNSAKAHFVDAEILAKQGQRSEAAGELATAERLAPGLPFAAPDAVAKLKHHLGQATATKVAAAPSALPAPAPRPAAPQLPWGMIFGGLGLIAFIVWASRLMAPKPAPAGNTYGGYPAQPAASPYGGTPGYAPGYGPAGPAAPSGGSGLGSQMLGGLATGAAVGAGVVAGEALMHRFLDGHADSTPKSNSFGGFDDIPSLPSTPLDYSDDKDFGISDAGSWDDGGGSDDEWN